MWQRRAFLKAAGAGLLASLAPQRAVALAEAELVYASAVQLKTGSYGAVLLNERGGVISKLALPDRGHDVTWSPVTGQGVVFARQPGTFAVVFDPKGRAAPLTLTAPEGRHFFGHGVFSPDGRLLYATENDFDAARGVIGIYDATADYRRIGEFDTYGIGPHEMLLMPDGESFVIANGGIETHPDYGRAELNIDTMDPSLVFVDRRTGSLVGQLRLAAGLHQLSIRHLAIDAKARVWFGCQYRGLAADQPQLVGYATDGGEIRLIELPETTLGSLKNYIGSVAMAGDGAVVAVSSPEGGTILTIDTATGSVVQRLPLDNGCGIAPDGTGFLASSGNGRLQGLSGAETDLTLDFGFDNHLRRLG
jgi:hypothetical protein